jgi:type I restriction enzyme S subunit
MRNGWAETTLGDIAEVLDRMRKPISASEREKRMGDVPYYGATGQAGWIDKPIFDEELVLLGEDAIDFLNPDVHKAYLISGPSWVNNHAHVLRAKREKVLSFFLMEALNAVDYSQFVAFGTRSKLTQGSMMGISVQVPPLEEQKRIVDVVSSVDVYIDALQQQVDSARTARNAVLHELLSSGGDDWTETTLGELLSRSIGGVWGGEPGSDQEEVTVVRSTEFTRSGVLNYSTGVFRSIRSGQLSTRELAAGDILLEKSGGGPEQPVGRVVYVESDIPPRFVCSNFIQLLTPIVEKVLPRFLFLQMWMWHFENRTLEFQAQTTGIRNLRTPDYLEQSVALPPVSVQKRIVEIVSSMDDVIQSTEQAVVDAKNLRSGLLSDLLSGVHEIPASYDVFVGAA